MYPARVRQIVNTLVEMLHDEGVDYDRILEELDLSHGEVGEYGLDWLNEEKE